MALDPQSPPIDKVEYLKSNDQDPSKFKKNKLLLTISLDSWTGT